MALAELTVDIEAKHKETAVLALRQELLARGWPVLGAAAEAPGGR